MLNTRLLLHVAGLVLIAGSASVAGGLLSAGSALYGMQVSPTASHAVLVVLPFIASLALCIWLPARVITRTTGDGTSPRSRMRQRGAAVGTGVLALCTTGAGPFGQAVFGCAVAWLALEVCRTHGLALDDGPRTSTAPRRRLTSWVVAAGAFTACAVGEAVMFALQEGFRRLDTPLVPVPPDQLSTLGITGLGDLTLGTVYAATMEDVVIVAAVTALLTAARRPAWQIYTFVCLLEVLLHAYMGVPALGMALYAAGRVWLYLRHGRLVPLMVGHFAFNLFSGLADLPVLYQLLLALSLTGLACYAEGRLADKQLPEGEPAAAQ